MNNRLVTIDGVKKLAEKVNDTISADILQIPDDENVYVLKGGKWQKATLVQQPSEWSPVINDTEEIVLTFDEEMTPYQLTGVRAGC